MKMGFRIEGIRKSDGAQVKNFKTTKDKNSVKQCLKQFIEENPAVITKYVRRLKAIRVTQESSPFFQKHEVIGSSLLFVHDKCGQASIWMIDFGKTVPLPESVSVTHRERWNEGNHEDGYLIGIDSLITIFEELENEFNLVETGSDSKDGVVQDNKSSVENSNSANKSSESSVVSDSMCKSNDENQTGSSTSTQSTQQESSSSANTNESTV